MKRIDLDIKNGVLKNSKIIGFSCNSFRLSYNIIFSDSNLMFNILRGVKLNCNNKIK